MAAPRRTSCPTSRAAGGSCARRSTMTSSRWSNVSEGWPRRPRWRPAPPSRSPRRRTGCGPWSTTRRSSRSGDASWRPPAGRDGPINMNTGSTDMANVSHEVPTIHPEMAIAPEGTPGHSREFAAHAAGPGGDEMLPVAIRVLAATGDRAAPQPGPGGTRLDRAEWAGRREAARLSDILGGQPADASLLAEIYDLEHDAIDEDLAFYRRVSRRHPGPVIDLGCGSGRLFAPLLAGGATRLVGIDGSPSLLQRAEARIAADAHPRPHGPRVGSSSRRRRPRASGAAIISQWPSWPAWLRISTARRTPCVRLVCARRLLARDGVLGGGYARPGWPAGSRSAAERGLGAIRGRPSHGSSQPARAAGDA